MGERHASQVEARGGEEASDIDDEVTEVAAPPQKKARQSKKWNPYKNLVLARARESFFPVQRTTGRVGNLTRLVHTLAICNDNTYYILPSHIAEYVQ